MGSKRTKMVSFAVALVMLVTLAIGCASAPEAPQPAPTPAPAPAPTPTPEPAKGPRTIIDQNGNVVEIPPAEEINRVVITAYPVPSVYYLLTGSVDKIVGIHPGAKSAAETSILGVMAPDILDIPSDFVKVTDLNMEEMLKLEPDLVIWWGLYANQIKQFEGGVVPAVAVKTQAGGNALETLRSWLELLGTIFGLEERADAIISDAYETLGEIYCQTWSVPDEEKPRAIFLWRHTDDQIVIPGEGHYGNFWLDITGAISAAEGVSVSADVNMEQIYTWDPDIIYITSFSTTKPEDLINNTIEGQDWSKVKAVRDGKVYKLPLGIFRWYPPSGDVSLMLKWLAQKNHPDLFKYDMAEEIKAFYKEFHNFDLSDEQVERILKAIPEAARE